MRRLLSSVNIAQIITSVQAVQAVQTVQTISVRIIITISAPQDWSELPGRPAGREGGPRVAG